MTNENDNIHWEESTTHRDKHQKTFKAKSIKALVGAINLGIRGFNYSFGLTPGVKKFDELDPDKTVAELAESGGSSFALGVIDDGLKFARKVIVTGIQSGGMWTSGFAALVSAGLFTIETSVDHLKDLLNSAAISGLAAEIGDLKDGQAKLNAKVDAQGKNLGRRMDNLKSELQGELKQQGEKFDKEIKNLDAKIDRATGEIKNELAQQKKALQQQKQELESQINQVTQNLNRVETQLTNALNDFKSEVNERFEEQEKKILDNKRKIEEERIKREEEIREVKDKIKITTTNVENLRKEKEELQDEVLNYKATIDRKTAETQQAFEDTQAEYERKTRLLETKLEDNEELLNEFQEDLTNTRHEQAQQRLQVQELTEELQDQAEILHFQKHKLAFVAQQMEEINEELHERMSNIQKDHSSLTNLAQDTSQKVNKLTEDIKEAKNQITKLEQQVVENKEQIQDAKKEAQLANERLDNLIKLQTLNDYSAEESKLDQITKSLELKAEETKLLATFNLLQETKKLILPQPAERDWKVGVQDGTAPQDFKKPEGMPLKPGSYWEKRYTGTQVKADNPHALFTSKWFNWEQENQLKPEHTKFEPWGTRIKNEHETAPLTEEEKRKEEETQPNPQETTQAAGEETQQSELVLEQVEELKSQILAQLQAVQQNINNNLDNLEAKEEPSKPKPETFATKLATTQQKVSQLKTQLAEKKTASQLTQAKLMKQIPAEIGDTKRAIREKAQQTQKEQAETEQALTQAEQELETLQASGEFEQEIEKQEESINEEKQEELKQEWQQIQALSQQVLEDKPKEEPKEEDLKKKLEELVQQIIEMEQSAAASQKTMTMWMLFLIIFLLEYVVYKRNGLSGLIILNVILAICYYKKEEILKHQDLWEKYFLIIGYVIGNVLAYSAPENPKYKWPSVLAFNAIILGIYAYTYYHKKQAEAKIETHYQQKSKQILQVANFTEADQKIITEEVKSMSEAETSQILGFKNPFHDPIPTSQKAEQFKEVVIEELEEQAIAQRKEVQIQQQTEVLQKAAEIEKNLAEVQAGLNNPEAKMTWEKIKQKYPEFTRRSILLKEFEIPAKKEPINPDFFTKLTRIPTNSLEENHLLAPLSFTLEQYITISCQSHYLTQKEKDWLTDNYASLNNQQKLQLLNLGLNNLGIETLEKKQLFIQLNHQLYQEKAQFGLTTKEKENILRLLVNTINLTKEQQEALEKMGVSFFDASNWHIDKTQKNHLLSFGLSKVILTENQRETLTNLATSQFKTFSFTEEQKNILQALAPLTREDKYSVASFELLKSLALKQSNLSFFTHEEIIPHPHLEFGEVNNPYLPLKLKYLAGEQKILRAEARQQEKQLSQQKIKENKLSIITSLVKFAKDYEENDLADYADDNIFSVLAETEQVEDLKLDRTLEEWIATKALEPYQADILLLLGLKTIPQYNFFELLIFAVEEANKQSFTEFLTENDWLKKAYQYYLKTPKQKPIIISVPKKTTSPATNLDLNELEELINTKIQEALGNYQPSLEEVIDSSEEEITETTPPPSATSSRYDNLFANLSAEEAERQRKKLDREEAKKKLEEAERKRRETLLTEKDRKLKEDAEKRAEEKALQEQEDLKRKEAEEAREKTLQEEREEFFKRKFANIEGAKRRAEENLANQKKQNELEEKKKRDEITKLEAENQAEQARLTKQAQLIEEEKQKKLAAIKLEDKEARQLIEKKANEERAKIEKEMNEKKRENERELKKKENALLKEREEKQIEINRMKEEAQTIEENATEMEALFEQEKKNRKELENERQRQLTINMNRSDAERNSRQRQEASAEKALTAIYYYPMLKEEWDIVTSGGSHFDRCPSVKEGFARYPNLKIKPDLFQFDSGKWVQTGSGERWTYFLAHDLRKTVALCKDKWFTKNELEAHIRNNVPENF